MNLIDVECEWSWLLGTAVVVVVVTGVASQLVQTVLEQLAGRRHGVRQTPPVHLLTSAAAAVTLVSCCQHAADADDDDEDEGDGEPAAGTIHGCVLTIGATTRLWRASDEIRRSGV